MAAVQDRGTQCRPGRAEGRQDRGHQSLADGEDAKCEVFDAGGLGGDNYTGQGAYLDSGHNYWNPIVKGGTTSSDLLSDGATASGITFTEGEAGDYPGGSSSPQGTPAELTESSDSYVAELLRTPRRQAERLNTLLPRGAA